MAAHPAALCVAPDPRPTQDVCPPTRARGVHTHRPMDLLTPLPRRPPRPSPLSDNPPDVPRPPGPICRSPEAANEPNRSQEGREEDCRNSHDTGTEAEWLLAPAQAGHQAFRRHLSLARGAPVLARVPCLSLWFFSNAARGGREAPVPVVRPRQQGRRPEALSISRRGMEIGRAHV